MIIGSHRIPSTATVLGTRVPAFANLFQSVTNRLLCLLSLNGETVNFTKCLKRILQEKVLSSVRLSELSVQPKLFLDESTLELKILNTNFGIQSLKPVVSC